MTPLEQSKLFRAAQQYFKKWKLRQISGYVHGVTVGLSHDEPWQDYVYRFKKKKSYAIGYIFGFIDAYGEDTLTAEWCQDLDRSEHDPEYRWWEHA